MLIYLPKHYSTRMAKKPELSNVDRCSKCGQTYSWKVGYLRQFEKPKTEEEDNRTRAMALFAEYRTKGIGPCCAKPEHRNFISRYCGGVTYY